MTVTYRSLPQLKIDGEEAAPEVLDNILQVIVDESLHRPSMFTLVVRNDYKPGGPRDTPWKTQKQLQIGQSISVGFGPSMTETEKEEDKDTQPGQLIQGEITGIETEFSESTQAPIVLRGYDLSHRLHRGRFNRSFQNMTDSDVVKEIVKEVNLETDQIDDSGEPHDYLFQENQTNMEFLRSRAARIGFELFVRDGKLNFRQPKSENTLKLKWLDNLRGFRVRVTSTEQVKEVEVRGWDYMNKQAIISNAQSEEVLTETEASKEKKGSDTSTAFENMKATPRMIVVDQPMFKPKEADAMAQAICDELGGQFVMADAKAEGNPEIRPGIVVELEDLGPYSGKYYVTETRHVYTERLYTTEFCVRGLRSGDLLTTISPPTQLRPGQTMLVGIVTDNEDPENLGRVKVKFPTLTEEHNSNWARVVSIGAANSRGFDCLPEIDDEVLVAFEHGDIHRPYVLGGVWNGEDAPPNSAGDNVQSRKVRLRTFQTRTGHKLQFVEEDKNEKTGVYVETQGGYKVQLNESDQTITITTPKGQQSMTLSDRDKTIRTTNMTGDIHTQALVGNIYTQAMGQINTTATGPITETSATSVSTTSPGPVSITGNPVTTSSPGPITITGDAVTMASAKPLTLAAPLINILGIPIITSPGIVPFDCQGLFSVKAPAVSIISGAISITGAAVHINAADVRINNMRPFLVPIP